VRQPRPLELMIILGALSALGAAATDMYFAALPAMARSFHAHPAALQLSLTTFMAGIATGQVFAGSMSDFLGRRRPLLAGLALYASTSIACAVAPSALTFAGARFLQGIGAAAGISIVRAIVRDLFTGQAASKMYARVFLVIGVAPVCAPSVGAFILKIGSWPAIFVVLSVWSVLLAAVVWWRLPETLPIAERQPPRLAETARSFRRLGRDGRFVGYAVTLGLGHAILVAVYAGAPFVVQETFGLSAQQYGAVFIVAASAMVVVGAFNGRLLQRFGERRMLVLGCAAGIVGGCGVVASSRWGLTVFLPCFTLLFGAWGLIPANAVALALRDHGAIAGAASSFSGVLQYVIAGAAAPLAGINGNDVTTVGIVVIAIAAAATCTALFTVRADRRFQTQAPLPVTPL
jgi:MFS transporter, DHA1 family, multidrug resistance protein